MKREITSEELGRSNQIIQNIRGIITLCERNMTASGHILSLILP